MLSDPYIATIVITPKILYEIITFIFQIFDKKRNIEHLRHYCICVTLILYITQYQTIIPIFDGGKSNDCRFDS